MIIAWISLSTVVLNSRDRYEKAMASGIFALLKTTLQQALAEKPYLDALVLLYLGCIFVKRSKKSNILIHSEF